MKIYRSFELRFGVKPELESVRIKAGIKIGVEALRVGKSGLRIGYISYLSNVESGNKGTGEQGEESKTKRKKKEKNR